MKRHYLFLITICLMTLTISCSKSTTGPDECPILFTIRFLDKDTGEDIISRDTSGITFLQSIRITNYVNWGTGDWVDSREKSINRDYRDGFTYLKFTSGTFNICKEQIYSPPKGDKYIINYEEGVQPDSITVRLERINADFSISCYLNDSLVEKITTTRAHTRRLELSVIDIRK